MEESTKIFIFPGLEELAILDVKKLMEIKKQLAYLENFINKAIRSKIQE